ncbi:amino acid ABC transporter permease [Brackiella oedipodis]|uniref:amino acid ABC transporter permease n=1 Tax=Brackiella oedipodis TaxID=124225 RepID=UPI0004912579|nr:amino acid ABC transporter permease [Brackiella oedipodis]
MTDDRAHNIVLAFWPMLKAGIVVSIPMAIVSFLIGMILALIVALIRVVPNKGITIKLLRAIARSYVSIIRGTPMLVQLCIVFYGLPALNIVIDPIPAAIIAFSLNVGAYCSETVRAAILSVHKGQWEAGYSIGMTYLQNFRHIIIPQAVRVAVPPLSNEFINLFKGTSLASFVTVTELFREASQAGNRTYDFLPVYIEAAMLYWFFCTILFVLQARLEKRLGKHIAV